ncbi:thioredoxin-disulfide reductase [Candidatus Daviesbacteria bacterium RIFCSPHIGHO2_02_FULL_39_12]|uniref:Thioredoxin reductase n=1 Tax=Candidatus Daviesbacteria bacterium RIFCSPHIGHO2_02_FULL_39_12 TaxID=1797770 RepID=A0A1F5JDF2_9BACT|nr:MAG: thioredoxin-disulfide reductase [Candidatus Daviesbacteria bacterium RIFCSPHIGHO2_02_FULL_39_12]
MDKLIIIGSGPAGLTAAIYAVRGGINTLVIAGREAGGQLMLTTDVDDFPGFETGIQGPELMAKMRKQAERFNVRFIGEDVVSVDFSKEPFTIKTETKSLSARSVILATGASAMWLNLESEQRLRGRGVSACAVCDGFFFKDKVVAVVGGGDTAMREANYLSKLATKAIVIHRRDALRAQAALQSLVKSKSNVEFVFNSTVEEVLGQDKVTGIKLKNTQTGEISQIELDGLFIAIGHKPNTGFLKGQIELDERGYAVVKDEIQTSVEGIFVAGDVSDHRYRQAVTAAGAGCKAAFDAEEYLENLVSV